MRLSEETEAWLRAGAEATMAEPTNGASRHFRDLDEAVAMLGRRERLSAAAAEVDDPHQRDLALRFAAVVAMADQHLDPSELAVLEQLGALFEWPPAKVHAMVEELR